ncbi:MAG TPA: hypothetical protein VG992_00070 [Candidatus Saccharimonadales bacterium]|nr:hypothetical protein [Candidatus Saccharimonadales bacterium]
MLTYAFGLESQDDDGHERFNDGDGTIYAGPYEVMAQCAVDGKADERAAQNSANDETGETGRVHARH